MFDDILGNDKEAEERRIKKHLQDVIDIFDYSTATKESTTNIWGNLYKWMVNVYGDEWEDKYDVILDWDKKESKYIIDVRRNNERF